MKQAICYQDQRFSLKPIWKQTEFRSWSVFCIGPRTSWQRTGNLVWDQNLLENALNPTVQVIISISIIIAIRLGKIEEPKETRERKWGKWTQWNPDAEVVWLLVAIIKIILIINQDPPMQWPGRARLRILTQFSFTLSTQVIWLTVASFNWR